MSMLAWVNGLDSLRPRVQFVLHWHPTCNTGFVRSFVLFALLAAPTLAQFRDFATTDDGSALYFSSRFRQTDEDQFLHPKIFRYGSAGFELVAQRERIAGPQGRFFNFFELRHPDVSGDGTLVTAVSHAPCMGGSSCLFSQQYGATILQGSDDLSLGPGWVQTSRNGRYLLSYSGPINQTGVTERLDRESGERAVLETFEYSVPSSRQCLTAAGEVLLVSDGKLSLWDGVEFESIALESTPAAAIVSDDGSRIVFETGPANGDHELWTMRADGTGLIKLAEPQSAPFLPALSNDGSVVVFVAAGRVLVADLGHDSWRILGDASGYATEATLSGDGRIVYATTRSNSLWKFDLVSGVALELVPRVVVADRVLGAPVPGSLNWIQGTGLAERLQIGAPPYDASLDGVRVRLGGVSAAVVAVAPEQLVIQIPWEAALGATEIETTGPESPFEWPHRAIDLVSRRIDIIHAGAEAYSEQLMPGDTVVVEQDFQSLITRESPARAGDIFHVYATGGGLVESTVTTGEPASPVPLPKLVDTLRCTYRDGTVRKPFEPLYAGLAPGLVGVYQVTFRIPASAKLLLQNPTLGRFSGECGNGIGNGFSVYVRPTQ